MDGQRLEKAQSITALGEAPEQERKSRMLKYSIAMTVRVVCIVAAIFVEGWLMWLCFAGAIFLPYFAVIIANAQGVTQGKISEVTKIAKPISVDLSSSDFGKR
jgi:predicted tellurium resistance membrane protein TerC